MVLSKTHVKDVCLVGGPVELTCRYLRVDDYDPTVFYCSKLRPTEKKKIDLLVRQHLKVCQEKKVDPSSPIGDNCPGYPILKIIQQGYDC